MTSVYKILVIDDMPDVRTTVAGILQDAGYAVRLAANEGESLAAVVEESFDFAFIDVRLHDGGEEDESGLSLAMAIRRLNEKIRIVLMTKHPVKSELVVRAIRYYGAIDFIQKDQNLASHILDVIAKNCQETSYPEWCSLADRTRLSVSLMPGQPLFLRAYGRYVRSARTWTIPRLNTARYTRMTEMAMTDKSNMRFLVNQIGTQLWKEVFADVEATTVYSTACAQSKLVSLLFETCRESLRLPLEFMHSESPSEYIVLSHPFARLVNDIVPKREAISPTRLATTKTLRVLLIASNTHSSTLPPIPGVDDEVASLRDSLGQKGSLIQVTCLPTAHATYERVCEELKKPDYDIIHYAGHGSFDDFSPDESSLWFWEGKNKTGSVKRMKSTELKFLLEQSEARLVYLSSCYGAATASVTSLLDDDFLGLADAVAQAGIPSIVCFRWPVFDIGATKLAQAFYRSLIEQGSPEIALWHARRELAAVDRDDPTWLSPVLIHYE